MKKEFNHINLQLFAEDSNVDTGNQDDIQDTSTKEVEIDTDDEVSRLKKELEEKEKQHQENVKKEVEKAHKEQQRLSKLSEEERKKEEQENKLKDIEQREKALNFKEKLSDVKDELIKRKLPTVFADKLVDDDNVKSLENINEFEKLFREAVQTEINSKIKGVNLKTGDNNATSFGKSMATKMNETKQNSMNPWAK